VRVKLVPETSPNQYENDEWQVVVKKETNPIKGLMSVTPVAGDKMILKYQENTEVRFIYTVY
jgi:hypothetical protein